jgi:hypothetical protein
MSTYAELSARLADTVENAFSAEQMAFFFQLAEQKIYTAVQLPALRKNQVGSLTATNKYLTLPTDFLYVFSLAVVLPTGEYSYLLDKDVNYIREAYPTPTATGTPRHYAIFDANTLIIGPTPADSLVVELHYGYYPESIVTAGTTWLSENFESVLFNCALLEAARFLKLETDTIANYQAMFDESNARLKMLGDGKLRQDNFRVPQVRIKPV